MFTFDLTKIFLLTFWSYQSYTCDLFLLALKFFLKNLPPLYYIGVDSTYLLGAIFWPKGQKVEIMIFVYLPKRSREETLSSSPVAWNWHWNTNEICAHFTWSSILLTYTFLLSSTISGYFVALPVCKLILDTIYDIQELLCLLHDG